MFLWIHFIFSTKYFNFVCFIFLISLKKQKKFCSCFMKRILILGLLVVVNACMVQAQLIERMRVNRMSEPKGIVRKALFSWQLNSEKQDARQIAYSIKVAKSAEALQGAGKLLWDSGKCESNKTLQIPYQGRKLPSASRIYWQVEVWLNTGEHEVSNVQSFLTGLLESEWDAQWICMNDFAEAVERRYDKPATYLRKEFMVQNPHLPAVLYFSTIGHGTVYLNGQKVSEDIFGTILSNWNRTIYYNTYEVTHLLRKGKNVLAVELGNGYTMGLRESAPDYGGPRFRAQLQQHSLDSMATPYVMTDTQWKVTQKGPILRNNLYDGEYYDARNEMQGWNMPGFNDDKWDLAIKAPRPFGVMLPQPCPGIRTQEELSPVSIKQLAEGRYLVDMGQNMVGQLRVTLKGTAGKAVTFRHAELVNEDTTDLYIDNLRSAKCTNVYVPAKDGVFTYQPSTVYQGFRFVEIDGLSEPPAMQDIVGCVQYDQMEETATFECDNPLLNRLFQNARWGIRGNYHGMPTDCPQRDERLGWTGDRLTGCYGENILFDNGAFYYKWLRDLQDTQNDEGQIADIAPEFYNGLRNKNVTWAGAFVYVTYMLYRRYGDEQAVWTYYPFLTKWVNYTLQQGLKDGIMTLDTYGDWCMPPEREDLIHSEDSTRKTDGAILATTVFYDILRMMTEMAQFTGDDADANHYTRTAMQLKANYNRKFFHADKGYYDNNTVTANILSLQLGLVPDGYEDEVMQHIVEVTENDFHSHVSCGVLGIQHLMRGLTRNGQLDLAWKMVNQRTYPSYGYMIDHGATTIWELWNGNTADAAMNSANHVMLLGDLLLWFFEDLAGIRNAEGFNGYAKLEMEPCFPKGLNHVKATQMTASGKVESEWTRQADRLQLRLRIPTNTIARIILPTAYGIMPVVGNGVHSVRQEGFNTIIQVGSGRYEWQTEY